MNCREFDQTWDDLLDPSRVIPAEVERARERHAANCPRCLAASTRLQVLHQAIAGLRPPTPSADSTARLHASLVAALAPTIPIAPPRAGRSARLGPPLAAAAAFVLGWLGGGGYGHRPGPEPTLAPATAGPRPLGLALAEATEATLDLAREASAPASRIGRDVFRPDPTPGPGSGSDPDLGPVDRVVAGDEPELAGPDLLRAVGERVNARVRPISGSARHAFSFLLGPPEDPQTPPPQRIDGL